MDSNGDPDKEMVYSLVCAFNDGMVRSYGKWTISWTDVPIATSWGGNRPE